MLSTPEDDNVANNEEEECESSGPLGRVLKARARTVRPGRLRPQQQTRPVRIALRRGTTRGTAQSRKLIAARDAASCVTNLAIRRGPARTSRSSSTVWRQRQSQRFWRASRTRKGTYRYNAAEPLRVSQLIFKVKSGVVYLWRGA